MDKDVILKRFEHPDETRILKLGKFEIVRLGGMTIGRATYEPGWKWSLHVGPELGLDRCPVEHVGLVILRPRSLTAASSRLKLESCSTFLPSHMTVGLSAMSRTYLCTSWVRTSTQNDA